MLSLAELAVTDSEAESEDERSLANQASRGIEAELLLYNTADCPEVEHGHNRLLLCPPIKLLISLGCNIQIELLSGSRSFCIKEYKTFTLISCLLKGGLTQEKVAWVQASQCRKP